jgi:hypothetical protein
MSEIDWRYPYPLWIQGYKYPFESRIIPQHEGWDKAVLIASCINSIEFLDGCRFKQRRVVCLLYSAMQLRKETSRFDQTPEWIRLSHLTTPTLVKFKHLLMREIEVRMTIYIDKDPEEDR